MGATTFVHKASGNSANDAFNNARKEALYDYGRRGYTGTIAEKDSFVMIKPNLDMLKVNNDVDINMYIDGMICAGDPRIDDKWGPAGCIGLGNNQYVFFGWASC